MKKLKHCLSRLYLLGAFFCLFLPALAQKSITGTITNTSTKAPLAGVTVLVKGTSQGTSTDDKGFYSITAKEGAVLVYTFVGFKIVEQKVAAGNTINIELEEIAGSLNEIVVTGYGSQSRKDITGAVAVVDTKALLSAPAANLAQAMQGRVAGVVVGSDNGPGGGAMVRIRGFSTINDNSPLYIIDGTPTKGNLNTLNLNDIESMQVLKDASAASIYGSRAGNGVVIITTRRGKAGKPKLTYDFYYGTQRPGKFLDLVNTQEYANLLWESRKNAGNVDPVTGNPKHAQFGTGATPVIPDYIFPDGAMEGDPRLNPANYTNNIDDPEFRKTKWLITKANKQGTNWLDVIFDPAPIMNHQLGVSGGNDNGRYAISFNYYDQKGILKYTNFKRYAIRANTEFKVNRFRIGENFQVSYSERVGQTNGNQSESNPISFAYRIQPIIPVYDIMGNFAGTKGGDLDNSRNPLSILYKGKDNVGKEMRVFGNGYAEFDILKNLTARTSLGIDYTSFNIRTYTIREVEASESAATNTLTTSNSFAWSWTWYNTLSYKTSFGDKHQVDFMIGNEAIKSYGEGFDAGRSRFFVDDLDNRFLNAGNAGTSTNSGIPSTEWRLASEFAKANYSYDDRYLLDLTVRRDRSSRFAPQNRSALFPAASLGWRLSDEAFMKNVSFFRDLKLRVGWGQTGNQEIGDFNYFTSFGTGPTVSFYDLNGSRTSSLQGYELTQFGNPSAKWETNTSTNIGLDATILNGKLGIALDLYQRTTSDMLFPVEVQFTQGVAANPFRNIAEMKNKGFDLGIFYNGEAIHHEMVYKIDFNISAYKNEVTRTDGNPNTQYFGFTTRLPAMSVTQQGHPLASYFGYVIDGIIQSDEEGAKHATQFGGGANNKAGQFKFRDSNGDGIINASDRVVIGNPHADFSYGFNFNGTYKNFSLTLFVQGQYGNELFNYVRYWTDFPTFGGIRSKRMLNDSWRPGKTDAKLPQLRSNDVISSSPSTYYLEDGSYTRIKNIQIGYNLPEKWLRRVGCNKALIYVQGQNLFTFTKYTGLDPEINSRNFNAGSDRQLGVDEGAYPVAKSFLVGVSLGF
ncbi:SusC/RagA family TonB-linked outer membrane protein [Foetidibacter luteolus]|uniref:SusC/RagA family TonB-linked outer membrane protein n=1 Tax=Foetidibacter luteolus TaxID=2608880 RepID=UPI00129B7C75|nr:TonB-dependent receptor [Foetidibacter luteolus]